MGTGPFWKLLTIEIIFISCTKCQDSNVTTPIRLVNGTTQFNGRVEVFYNGTWGTICQHEKGKMFAKVVCRQLGYITDNVATRSTAFYGAGSGPIWQDVVCYGNERVIEECMFKQRALSYCSHDLDVGVTCSFVASHIRLQNGTTQSEGRVEVFHNGTWGTICNNNFNRNLSKVICRQLGYATDNTAVRSTLHFGEGSGPIWLDYVLCQADESLIDECMLTLPWGQSNCGHLDGFGVICNSSSVIRLQNGTTPLEGRLEVFHNETWGTVCGYDGFKGRNLATVVCRQLGYATDNVKVRLGDYFGEGSGLIWLDDVYCLGYEVSIDKCSLNRLWGEHNCGHHDDFGVICYVTCSVPVVEDTSKDSGTTIVYNTTVTYTCAEGYIVTNGSLVRTCQADGQLDGTSPTCTPETCSVPDVNDATKDSGGTIVHNTTVTYTCAEGHIHTDGNLVRICQAGGQLDGSSPTCTRDCGTVPAVPYSTYTTPTNTLQGAHVTYSCNAGYTAAGAETTECLTSGWTTRPVCHPDLGYDCTNITCTDPNAVCDGDTLLCSCPTGYFYSNGAAVGGTCEVKPSQVSAVVIAVPIACVLVVILSVTIACFIKHRRKQREAENGNNNNCVSGRRIVNIQELASEECL